MHSELVANVFVLGAMSKWNLSGTTHDTYHKQLEFLETGRQVLTWPVKVPIGFAGCTPRCDN